jgi:hypothetical protein
METTKHRSVTGKTRKKSLKKLIDPWVMNERNQPWVTDDDELYHDVKVYLMEENRVPDKRL